MDNILYSKINSNNNELLLEIMNKLENIIKDNKINNTDRIEIIIKQIKDILILLNSAINDNNKKYETIREDIQNMKKDIIEEIKNDKNTTKETKIYDTGKFEGEITNKLRNGKGTMYYNNGDIYKGEWKKDKKEGEGIYYYKDGNKYEGRYKNDKQRREGDTYL